MNKQAIPHLPLKHLHFSLSPMKWNVSSYPVRLEEDIAVLSSPASLAPHSKPMVFTAHALKPAPLHTHDPNFCLYQLHLTHLEYT